MYKDPASKIGSETFVLAGITSRYIEPFLICTHTTYISTIGTGTYYSRAESLNSMLSVPQKIVLFYFWSWHGSRIFMVNPNLYKQYIPIRWFFSKKKQVYSNSIIEKGFKTEFYER